MDASEESGETSFDTMELKQEGSSTKIKMADAMKQYGVDELDILNQDAKQSDLGALFEKVNVPGN